VVLHPPDRVALSLGDLRRDAEGKPLSREYHDEVGVWQRQEVWAAPVLWVWKQGMPANAKFELVIHRTRGDVTIDSPVLSHGLHPFRQSHGLLWDLAQLAD